VQRPHQKGGLADGKKELQSLPFHKREKGEEVHAYLAGGEEKILPVLDDEPPKGERRGKGRGGGENLVAR